MYNKVLVLGGGKSGMAASHALKNLGATPVIIPDTRNFDLKNLPKDLDLAVISPGIALHDPVPKKLMEHGVKIISELELGWKLCRSKIIAVTGTNGKTTAVSLIAHMLKCANIETEALGNIGKPFCAAAPYFSERAALSLEVSSFQLETIETFRPDVAVLLNVTPDHLDRHKSMEEYLACKLRVFKNQTKDCLAIINADDPLLRGIKTSAKKEYISTKRRVRGAYLAGDTLKYHGGTLVKRGELKILGLHNIQNALAASCAAIRAGADVEAVRYALKTFTGLPHRLQYVCSDGKIKFINDSKATNPDSCLKGVNSVEGNIILIMGGSLKDTDFTTVFSQMPKNVLKVIACGAAAKKLLHDAQAAAFYNIMSADKLEDATEIAYSEAKKTGEDCTVLLSPSCASFDQFSDYRHRGEVFSALSKKLCEYDQVLI